MRCHFYSRRPLQLLCVLLVASLAACSREGAITTSKGNLGADEKGGNSEVEPQMAKQPTRGFKEYVKNPGLFRVEAEAREAVDTAPPPTPQEVAGLVSTMGKRRLDYGELQRLEKAGDKVIPALRAVILDEKYLFHPYGASVSDGTPLEPVLDLLEPFRLPEANFLEPALKHPAEYVRTRTLYHLARCGNDDAIDALKAGLKSESEACRTWTLMGLEFVKRTGRGSKKFRDELFEGVQPLLRDKEYGPSTHAPRVLLVLDFNRAKTVLLGADTFNPQNSSVNRVLQSLKDADVPVPAPQLRGLLSGIKQKAVDYPFDYAYAEGLVLLARVEGTGANDLIADARKWGNEKVRGGAADASVVAVGVTDAYAFVCEIYERKGVKGLTDPQRHYLTLALLDGEVRNGGFSQYYFNSSGGMATYAVDAAKAVGASEQAAIIQSANALFGKGGPDTDRERRMGQLSKVDDTALEKLTTRYYECPEKLGELLPAFVARNPASFKPAK